MIRGAAIVSLVVLVAAGSAAAGTVTLGKGLPPWKLGQRYVQRPGLVRSERFAGATPGPGACRP